MSSTANFMLSTRPACGLVSKLAPSSDSEDDPQDVLGFGPLPREREDLPYYVELWDNAKLSVEQVLAMTANGGIGFAAYFGATREFPTRYITLRHKHRILSSWNGPGH